MKNTIFTGAGVALVTPFAADGTIDYDVMAQLIEDQIAAGTDALIIAGTTGESSTLTEEEHVEVIRFAVERAAHRVPVIAGTGSNDTAFCIALSQDAERVGADALLLVTPYYNKATQKGLYIHYKAIADAVNLPIILYNVPSRTGVNIEIETVAKLAALPNIVAIKEASGNISYVAKLMERCGDIIDVYSGNDDQIVPMMALGAKGVISVLSNVCPKETHDMAMAALQGDYQTAAKLQLDYLNLINALFIEVNPIPVKEAMNLMGMQVGECRLPLCEMEEKNREVLRAALAKHDLLA
ncbi:MAG: 4-hydroxy-tetrahydrodipicolinate synthase [Oscillospiraceae bacterium]|nr:4-hydroxy-tetrahydrodipicolinate synthase [Oscillospiraceae bacterium]